MSTMIMSQLSVWHQSPKISRLANSNLRSACGVPNTGNTCFVAPLVHLVRTCDELFGAVMIRATDENHRGSAVAKALLAVIDGSGTARAVADLLVQHMEQEDLAFALGRMSEQLELDKLLPGWCYTTKVDQV